MGWKRLSRKTIYDTKFLKVFEDRIELPNGNIHENYSVIKLPDVIVIVATDVNGQIIVVSEYKYGADKVIRSFPAGHIEEGEDPTDAAKRELLEETGYGGGVFEYIGVLREFVTKNLSVGHVIRALDVHKTAEQNLDENENLNIELLTKEQLLEEIRSHKWEGAKEVAAITLTGLLNS